MKNKVSPGSAFQKPKVLTEAGELRRLFLISKLRETIIDKNSASGHYTENIPPLKKEKRVGGDVMRV